MATLLQDLGRNLRWLVGSELLGRTLGFLYIALLARLIGLTQFGYLTLALSYTELFVVVAGFSFNEVLIREAAPHPEKIPSLVSRMLRLQLLLALPLAAVGLILGGLYGSPFSLLLPLGAGIGWFRGMSQTFLAVPASQQDLRPTATYTMLERLLNLAALVVLLVAGRTVQVLFMALLGCSLLNLLFAATMAGRHGAFLRGPHAEPPSWMGLLRDGFAYSSLRWLGIAYKRLDTVILERLTTPEILGLYGAAYRLFEVFTVIPNVAERVLYPLFSRIREDLPGIRTALRRSVKALGAVSVPLSVGAGFLALTIVRIVYGDAFTGAAAAWPILMISLTLGCLNRPFLVLVRAERRLGIAFALTLIALVLNAALNLWLIPLWNGDVRAPAVAKAIGDFVILAGFLWIYRSRIDLEFGRGLLKLLPAAAVLVAVLLVTRPLGPWIATGAGAICYMAVLFFIIGLDADDRSGLRGMWPK
jgi:O-antigen/teichoic acid export membrane protein